MLLTYTYLEINEYDNIQQLQSHSSLSAHSLLLPICKTLKILELFTVTNIQITQHRNGLLTLPYVPR